MQISSADQFECHILNNIWIPTHYALSIFCIRFQIYSGCILYRERTAKIGMPIWQCNDCRSEIMHGKLDARIFNITIMEKYVYTTVSWNTQPRRTIYTRQLGRPILMPYFRNKSRPYDVLTFATLRIYVAL